MANRTSSTRRTAWPIPNCVILPPVLMAGSAPCENLANRKHGLTLKSKRLSVKQSHHPDVQGRLKIGGPCQKRTRSLLLKNVGVLSSWKLFASGDRHHIGIELQSIAVRI